MGFHLARLSLSRADDAYIWLGQVAWTPEREIVGIGDAEAQTEYAIDNIQRVLSELGGDLTDVVSLTMYYFRDQ